MDDRPSSFYHPQEVRDFNGQMRAKNAAGLDIIDLSEQSVVAAARRDTGLDCFGDACFEPGLRMVLRSAEEEAHLNPFGRKFMRDMSVAWLKNRLWANACFEAHPEILQRKISAPIVIVGLPRSGTTRLQRMLSADPRLQFMRVWEGLNPAPRLGLPDLGRAARYAEVEETLGARMRLNPGATSAHPQHPDWAEEELMLLNHSFCGLFPVAFLDTPSYHKWICESDRSDAYRYMASLMKLLSWSRGDAESKRWIMKTPQHMLDLRALIEVFPDAKLVFALRDPIKTVGSALSLAWNYSLLYSDLPRRASIRDAWLFFCEKLARTSMEVRATLPASQQLNVFYEDMNRDWRGVMKQIYEFADVELTPAAEQALAGWLADSGQKHRYGAHRYALKDYGVTAEEIDARMQFYRERYAIPYEKKSAWARSST